MGSLKEKNEEKKWVLCSVCNEKCICVAHPHAVLLKVLFHDLSQSASVLRPSAYSRLIHVFLRSSQKLVLCGQKCARMIVRFGLLGHGGVVRSRPSSDELLLTSLPQRMIDPPDIEFANVDFRKAVVLDACEDDIPCAASVASCVADCDGLEMDPFFVFAAGRHIASRPLTGLGMELRDACDAVVKYGCLPARDAPFHIGAARETFADWAQWQKQDSFEALSKVAFSHRKQAYYQVAGPHDNLFDNIRAALWTYRSAARSVVVAMKWRTEWLNSPEGVISSEKRGGGFYTAVKVVGQSFVNGEVRLILQGCFGPAVGNKGFFYATRGTVNRHCKMGAYIFLDHRSISEATGAALGPPIYRDVLSKGCGKLLRHQTQVLELLRFLSGAGHRLCAPHLVKSLQEVLSTVPASLLFAVGSTGKPSNFHQQSLLDSLMRMHTTQSSAQLAFLWCYVTSPGVVDWLVAAFPRLQEIYDSKRLVEAAVSVDRKNRTSSVGRATSSPKAAAVAAIRAHRDDSAASSSPSFTPVPPAQLPALKAAPAQRQRKSIAKAAEEPVTQREQNLLDEAAAHNKGEHEALLMDMMRNNQQLKDQHAAMARRYQKLSSYCWATPKPVGCLPMLRDASSVSGVEESPFPLELVGESWLSLNIPSETGMPSKAAVFFQGPYLCWYDIEAPSQTTRLSRISQDPSFASLPFCNGFDGAAVCSFVNPHEAFFFSRRHWLVWDLSRHALLRGPFDISEHVLFSGLPLRFRESRVTVLDCMTTPSLLFILNTEYVEYDIAQQKVVAEGDFTCSKGKWSQLCKNDQLPFACIRTISSSSGLQEMFVFRHRDGAARISLVHDEITVDDLLHLSDTPFCDLQPSFFQYTVRGAAAALRSLVRSLPKKHVSAVRSHIPVQLPSAISPSVLCTGAMFSAATVITSTLRSVEGRRIEELLAPFPSSGEDSGGMSTLCDGALESGDAPCTHLINYDFGSLSMCDFGYLQVVLAAAPLARLAFSMEVRCSWDGVGYRTVSCTLIHQKFSHAFFPNVHSCRYWQIAFCGLPAHVQVVKTIFHRVDLVPESQEYCMSRPFVTKSPATVRVEAPSVLKNPQALLDEIGGSSVFATVANELPGGAWHVKHCCVPLLPPAESCLFVCGDTFVEWDMQTNSVVGSRCQTFEAHPAFCNLPFPFNHGFDAAFYPDIRNSRNLVLVSSTTVVEWSLEGGCTVGEASPLSSCFWLAGLPSPFCEGVDAIVNVWDRPGHLYIFRDSLVMTWDVISRTIVEAPRERDAVVRFCIPDLDSTLPLMSAVCFPSNPTSTFIFVGDRVCMSNMSRDGKTASVSPPRQMGASPYFAQVPWFLLWGKPRLTTRCSFDFHDEQPLFIGVTIRSVDGTNPETTWAVECSPDGEEWTTVATHLHNRPSTTAMWHPCATRGVGCRHWRLCTVSVRAQVMVEYNQIVFHELPSTHFSVDAMIEHTPNCSVTGSLLHEGELHIAGASRQTPVGLVFDFGDESAAEICGVQLSAVSNNEPHVSDVWVVSFSDDKEVFTTVGSWRLRTACAALHWCPALPHRFWQLELVSSMTAAPRVFSRFAFMEYTGPSVLVPGQYWNGLFAVLSTSNETERQSSRLLRTDTAAGSTIPMDFKGDPQDIVGMRINAVSESLVHMTKYEVEYSDDAEAWWGVSTIVTCDGIGMSTWPREGPHRFWRLRVICHSGPTPLEIVRITLFQATPSQLYRRHKRFDAQVLPDACIVFATPDRAQMELVRFSATVPPSSTWIVERAGSEPGTWDVLSAVINSTAAPAACSCAWPLGGASIYWRVRNVPSPDSASPASVGSLADVEWYSFENVVHVSVKDANERSTTTANHFVVSTGDISVLNEPLASGDGFAECSGCLESTLTWAFNQLASFSKVIVRGVTVSRASPSSDASPVRILVECSDDGKRFDAIRTTTIPTESTNSVISVGWGAHQAATVWRIRFCFADTSYRLQLSRVAWYTLRESTAPHSHSTIGSRLGPSNVLHNRAMLWGSNDRIREETLRSVAKAATNASSFLSGFIQSESELDDLDQMVLHFLKLQKMALRPIIRLLKDSRSTTGSRNRPTDGATKPQPTTAAKPTAGKKSIGGAGAGAPASVLDVCNVFRLFSISAVRNVSDIIGSAVLSDFKLMKESGEWPLPKTEFRGTLLEPLLGFTGCPSSFSVRWLLRPCMLRHLSAITTCDVVDPRVSAVLFCFRVVSQDWMANASFPTLAPLLYELALGGRPFIGIFSSSTLTVSHEYPLAVPGGPPIDPPQPLDLYGGFNYVCELKLPHCVSHAFIVIAKYFAADPRGSVIAAIHQRRPDDTCAHLRFSLPTKVDFGVSGLNVSSMFFELWWEGPTFRRVSFTTADAVLSIKDSAVPVTLVGQLSQDTPVVVVRGRASGGSWDRPCGLSNSYLTEMSFNVAALTLDSSHQFSASESRAEGMLVVLPMRQSLHASLRGDLSQMEHMQLQLHYRDLSVDSFVAMCVSLHCVKVNVEAWIALLPLRITSAALDVTANGRAAQGRGKVSFGECDGFASFTVCETAISITAEFELLKVGDIVVESNQHQGPVFASFVINEKSSQMRITGASSLLTNEAIPCKIELDASGLVFVSSTEFMDICITEPYEGAEQQCAEAVVASFDVTALEKPLAELLLTAPIVTALLSNGFPFSFALRSVNVADCDVKRKTLIAQFRGMLMGSSYDVTVPCSTLRAAPTYAHTMAAKAVGGIIEQCSDALWSSVVRFVPNRSPDDGSCNEENRTKHTEDPLEGTMTVRYNLSPLDTPFASPIMEPSCRLGTFLSQWESQYIERSRVVLDNGVEPV